MTFALQHPCPKIVVLLAVFLVNLFANPHLSLMTIDSSPLKLWIPNFRAWALLQSISSTIMLQCQKGWRNVSCHFFIELFKTQSIFSSSHILPTLNMSRHLLLCFWQSDFILSSMSKNSHINWPGWQLLSC